ncbi:MAG: YqeG family HAD IIIA-type phosphatase [Sakamotonia sp.]|jgi:HAD superfamily phosphatase (TIGR01668 family)
MLESFFPDEYVDSAYGIPYEELYQRGYRGIIFDVDNTLVPHGAPADARSIGLFERLRAMGFSTCILSNNKEPRVAPFAGQVKSPYIFKAGKPSVKGYGQAMEVMGTERENTLFVGDQLFTDVWGARRTGLYSILTKPMDPHEEIQIVFKRYLEAVVLRAYEKKRRRPAP